jgi:hypothetical protein
MEMGAAPRSAGSRSSPSGKYLSLTFSIAAAQFAADFNAMR